MSRLTSNERESIQEAYRTLRASVGYMLDRDEPFLLADVCEAAYAADDLALLFVDIDGDAHFGKKQREAYLTRQPVPRTPWSGK